MDECNAQARTLDTTTADRPRPSHRRGAAAASLSCHGPDRRIPAPEAHRACRPPTPIEPTLRIGEVADRTGVTPRTIRYWEEIGLLGAAHERPEGKHRLYAEADLERISEIVRLRDLLGLSLEQLSAVAGGRERPCPVATGVDQDRGAGRAQTAAGGGAAPHLHSAGDGAHAAQRTDPAGSRARRQTAACRAAHPRELVDLACVTRAAWDSRAEGSPPSSAERRETCAHRTRAGAEGGDGSSPRARPVRSESPRGR